MNTKISKTLVLGTICHGLPDVYYTNDFGIPDFALCRQAVNRCLGTRGSDNLPETITVTASVKPLKIKGTRKVMVNFGLSTFDGNVWKFATDKDFPGTSHCGMYRWANMQLRKLLEANDIIPGDGLWPIWVHVKVVKA